MKPFDIDEYLFEDSARKANYFELLLKAGVDINKIHPFHDETILSWAARFGNVEMIRELLKHNIDTKYPPNMRAISWAMEYKNIKTVEMLLDAHIGVSADALTCAMMNNNGDMIKAFLTVGVNTDARELGYIMVHYTMSDEIAEMFIDAGADINVRDIRGRTILMSYVLKNNEKIVKMLLNAGAEIDAVNEDSDTAMSLAIARKYRGIVEILESYSTK